MLGSSILDVAIGMALIYLLLSLIASTVHEAMASLVQARPANLEHGIRSLFSGSYLENGELFVDKIYRHGLVLGLYRDPKLDLPRMEGPITRLDLFFNILRRAWRAMHNKIRKMLRHILGMSCSVPIAGISDPFLMPAYIPARTFALALIDILNPEKQNGRPPLENIEEHLIALCQRSCQPDALNPNKAAEAMLALIADAKSAEDSAEKFRTNLENWYSDAMDRVSGWYKKDTQKALLIIGLLLAVVFNVDSIRVGRTLWFDRDARLGLVNAADAYVKKDTPNTANAADTSAPKESLADRMKTTVQAFDEVSSEYLLPVGWHYSVRQYEAKVLDYHHWDAIHILEQLLGWIVTAFALSLGAPFWFDLLNKFMVVRSTIKPQEKSRTEDSKD